MSRAWILIVTVMMLATPCRSDPKRKDQDAMTNKVDVTARSVAGTLWQTPVPVVIAITNHESEPVRVLLPYPYPGGLTFECATSDFVQSKPVDGDVIQRSAPVEIKPGETWHRRYFLNRYFVFRQPGSARFSFDLHIAITYGASSPVTRDEAFDGSFLVTIADASEAQRRARIGEYGAMLGDPDPTRRTEAAEALGFLDTPDVVPQLIAMLRTADFRASAIRALGRHPSPETARAIGSALSDSEFGVVSAALEEIHRLHITPPRTSIQSLLGSKNPGVVYLALDWLSTHPSREDLPFLAPLLSDPNDSLRSRARDYQRQLTAN